MYLYFHLGFKIPGKLYSYIFKTETRVFFLFFFVIQQHLKEPQFTGVGGYTYMKL
jgi:hypothetical protein